MTRCKRFMYMCAYVCIMYKEEGRICDELGGTAVIFFLVFCYAVRIRNVRERGETDGEESLLADGLIWLSLRGGCFPASISIDDFWMSVKTSSVFIRSALKFLF